MTIYQNGGLDYPIVAKRLFDLEEKDRYNLVELFLTFENIR